MRYSSVLLNDFVNGTGLRTSLFVSGCTNHCKGCFQPQTWDFNYGNKFTQETEDFIISELSKPYYKGLTLLGGEPFEPENQKVLKNLVKRIKKELPEKDIWAYTGFVYEDDLLPNGRKYSLDTDEYLDNIDILVDGKFVEELKKITLNFRGSSNQRIINMKETRTKGSVVLSELNN